MKVNWRMVVEVFVPDKPGSTTGRIATGCPIAKNLILTAGHVLQGSEALPQIRWRFDDDEKKWEWVEVTKVLYNGVDEQLDAAVLETTFPESVECFSLNNKPVAEHAKWSGFGFPDVGEREVLRKGVPMIGECMPSSGTTVPLGVKYEIGTHGKYADQPEDGWKGASGSPVFVEGRIVGVIQSCPRNFDARRLEAVPIQRLLDSKKFQSAIGFDPVLQQKLDARQESVKANICRVLCRQPLTSLSNVLSRELGLSSISADSQRANAVAEKLFSRSLEQVAYHLLHVHEQCCHQKDHVAAAAAWDIFRMLIPMLYPREVVSDLHRLVRNPSVGVLSIDVGAPVGVGVALDAISRIELSETDLDESDAAFLGKEVRLPQFEMVPGSESIGEGPEGGMDPHLDSEVKDIIQDLGTSPAHGIHLTDSDRARADSLSRNGGVTKVAEEYGKVLNRRIDFLYNQRRQRFFLAFLVDDSDDGKRREAVMTRLSHLVSKLVVVRLSDKDAFYNRDMLIQDCLTAMAKASEESRNG